MTYRDVKAKDNNYALLTYLTGRNATYRDVKANGWKNGRDESRREGMETMGRTGKKCELVKRGDNGSSCVAVGRPRKRCVGNEAMNDEGSVEMVEG